MENSAPEQPRRLEIVRPGSVSQGLRVECHLNNNNEIRDIDYRVRTSYS